MPVSLATQRDPFRSPNAGATPSMAPAPTTPDLRVPQARCLEALMPEYPEDPPINWPTMGRAHLQRRAGYSPRACNVTRAMNGIPSGSSSGDPHPGLLALGYVEVMKIDLDGAAESIYRITRAGIAALQAYVAAGNQIPKPRSTEASTNKRYKE